MGKVVKRSPRGALYPWWVIQSHVNVPGAKVNRGAYTACACICLILLLSYQKYLKQIIYSKKAFYTVDKTLDTQNNACETKRKKNRNIQY